MSEIIPKLPDDDDDENWAGDPKRMGFLDHLEEFRWTLLKPLAVFLVVFITSLIFIKKFKDLLFWPLFRAMSQQQQDAFEGLVTMNVTGVFTAMLHIGLLTGVTAASPFFLYYVGKFVAPALKAHEQKALIPGTIGAFGFFLLGSCFGFFGLLPVSIKAVMFFNYELMGTNMIWTTNSYFSFITWTVLGMGLSFQMPLVVLVLNMLGIVSVAMLRKFRRAMAVIIVIVAAVITPPDPLTQLLLAVPMYLLYELAIWAAAIMERKRHAAERKAEKEYEDEYGNDERDYLE